jgi:hypothetical protein
MKKLLSSCEECGEEKSILTQVSCTMEIKYLCSECYNNKYSEEINKENPIDKIKPNFLKN